MLPPLIASSALAFVLVALPHDESWHPPHHSQHASSRPSLAYPSSLTGAISLIATEPLSESEQQQQQQQQQQQLGERRPPSRLHAHEVGTLLSVDTAAAAAAMPASVPAAAAAASAAVTHSSHLGRVAGAIARKTVVLSAVAFESVSPFWIAALMVGSAVLLFLSCW